MIRPATEADIPAIVDLGQQFLAASPIVSADRESMVRLARQLIESPTGDVLVDDREGVILGNLGVIAYADPYSAVIVASELFWWVREAERGGRTALSWMKAFDLWSQSHGAALQRMVALDARTGAFYERLGYKPIETHYQRTVA